MRESFSQFFDSLPHNIFDWHTAANTLEAVARVVDALHHIDKPLKKERNRAELRAKAARNMIEMMQETAAVATARSHTILNHLYSAKETPYTTRYAAAAHALGAQAAALTSTGSGEGASDDGDGVSADVEAMAKATPSPQQKFVGRTTPPIQSGGDDASECAISLAREARHSAGRAGVASQLLRTVASDRACESSVRAIIDSDVELGMLLHAALHSGNGGGHAAYKAAMERDAGRGLRDDIISALHSTLNAAGDTVPLDDLQKRSYKELLLNHHATIFGIRAEDGAESTTTVAARRRLGATDGTVSDVSPAKHAHAVFKIVSGKEHVSIDEDGCVTDGAGDHGANEKSVMEILADGKLETKFLDTGDCFTLSKYDYLQLNDNVKQVWQCQTKDGPHNVAVKAGDKLTWTTDGHEHGEGFVVCLTPDVVLTKDLPKDLTKEPTKDPMNEPSMSPTNAPRVSEAGAKAALYKTLCPNYDALNSAALRLASSTRASRERGKTMLRLTKDLCYPLDLVLVLGGSDSGSLGESLAEQRDANDTPPADAGVRSAPMVKSDERAEFARVIDHAKGAMWHAGTDAENPYSQRYIPFSCESKVLLISHIFIDRYISCESFSQFLSLSPHYF